jgi:hypothetical protein
MACDVHIVADSISPEGNRITTFQLKYWRAIHAELMTHRVFSRNASSSRAVPVSKMLAQVWNDPAGPIHWGANRAGMQAKEELQGVSRFVAQFMWKFAARTACVFAWTLMKIGLHKQVANRLLEPWQYIHVVLTATEYANWFALRDHQDAQPEICELAREMRKEMVCHYPRRLSKGEWHMPYIEDHEALMKHGLKIKTSVAKCCRVSYVKHDGFHSNLHENVDLHDKLVKAVPPHMSPTEHQAMCMDDDKFYANFRGWKQYRMFIENNESIYD